MEFDEWNFRHAWWVGLCCFFGFLIPGTVQRFKTTITHLCMYFCSLQAPDNKPYKMKLLQRFYN